MHVPQNDIVLANFDLFYTVQFLTDKIETKSNRHGSVQFFMFGFSFFSAAIQFCLGRLVVLQTHTYWQACKSTDFWM